MTRKIAIFLLLLALLAGMVTAQEATFSLTEESCLYLVTTQTPTQEQEAMLQLLYQEFSQSGWTLPLQWGAAESAPVGAVWLVPAEGLAAEHYAMEITPEHIRITGDTRGLCYGGREVLRRLLLGQGLECGSYSDGPDTAERGLMIDCARKYWSVPWLKNLIAQMSWLGYNTLQLHMAEDQGIRWNIWSDGPDCNGNDFSFLIGYNSGWNTDYPDPNGDCFYTAAELKELVEFARAYGIDVIPDYDMPAHCNVLTQRYADYVQEHPEFTFTYDGVTYSAAGMTADGVTTPYDTDAYPNADFFSVRVESTSAMLDVTNPVGRAFCLAVGQAYGDFFRQMGCTAFHVGFDELNVKNGDGWGDYAQAYIDGGSTATDTVVDFANEVAAMLKALGYTSVRAFNDVLYGEERNIALDEDIQLYVWSIDGTYEVEQYQADGRTLFNCIQNYCYYALRYINRANGGDARDSENYWWSFHHATPERIYKEWSPARMYNYDAEGTPMTELLGGGYFLIWADFGGWRTERQVWEGDEGGTYNLIDRLWSNAAKQWDWDAQETLRFRTFEELRESLHFYPGFTDCQAVPPLPGGAELICVPTADHGALQEVLAQTDVARDEAAFTLESYADYWRALELARAVDENIFSTQVELEQAAETLQAAAADLTFTPAEICIPIWKDGQKISALRGNAFLGSLYILPLPELGEYAEVNISHGVMLENSYVIGMATVTSEITIYGT